MREVHLNDESFRAAFDVWQDKTDWVQKDRRFDVLKPWGWHRADVLKAFIEHLEESNAQVIQSRDHYSFAGRGIAEMRSRLPGGSSFCAVRMSDKSLWRNYRLTFIVSWFLN